MMAGESDRFQTAFPRKRSKGLSRVRGNSHTRFLYRGLDGSNPFQLLDLTRDLWNEPDGGLGHWFAPLRSDILQDMAADSRKLYFANVGRPVNCSGIEEKVPLVFA